MERTRIVLVSHSDALARGLSELAGQMAPDVDIHAVGGLADGSLGTDFERIEAAVTGAPGEVVVLADLGSAVLTTQAVLEIVDDDVAARTHLVPGPFVEGAVACAVAAQGGADALALVDVVREAAAAVAQAAGAEPGGAAGPDVATGGEASLAPAASVTRTVTVVNPYGLHARPAAEVARLAADQPASVMVGGVDGTSVLALMALGVTAGAELEVTASGEGAEQAVAAITQLISSGFGET
ncbi:dihydroxyacetone kinase phosphoryl donor subunit DhaM [Sanguibacter sp. A247]|uniref:dihydroxyacetone kinase phosphoryl donor subunit DhaM n=1 Tax=unclassified Sanguibacter TaxID=2645534 RepID=UPI003FD8154C